MSYAPVRSRQDRKLPSIRYPHDYDYSPRSCTGRDGQIEVHPLSLQNTLRVVAGLFLRRRFCCEFSFGCPLQQVNVSGGAPLLISKLTQAFTILLTATRILFLAFEGFTPVNEFNTKFRTSWFNRRSSNGIRKNLADEVQ